jgi:hypothetical protein
MGSSDRYLLLWNRVFGGVFWGMDAFSQVKQKIKGGGFRRTGGNHRMLFEY